jgi:hypothetical protein
MWSWLAPTFASWTWLAQYLKPLDSRSSSSPGNPVRFPYSQAIPTSIPSEFSDPKPWARAIAFAWTLSDELNLERKTGRFRLLQTRPTRLD